MDQQASREADQEKRAKEYRDRLWSWSHHEDTLFDSRFEKFSIIHGLLLSCVAFTLQRERSDRTFLYVVAALGIALGLLWLLVQLRSKRLLLSIEAEIHEIDALYRKHISWGAISQPLIMSLVPGVVVILWIIFAMAVHNNWIS